jgi:hypothetical protein
LDGGLVSARAIGTITIPLPAPNGKILGSAAGVPVWIDPPAGGGGSGDDGREVTFRTTSAAIEWQYVGEGATWRTLVALTDLEGPPGAAAAQVEMRSTATAIQWRRVGDPGWTDLVQIDGLGGGSTPVDYNKTGIKPIYYTGTAWPDRVVPAGYTGPVTWDSLGTQSLSVPPPPNAVTGDRWFRWKG